MGILLIIAAAVMQVPLGGATISKVEDTVDEPWSILRRGAGEWLGEETTPPAPWAPDGMESTARLSASLILGGRGLASDYRQEIDGQISMRSHTVIWWDEARAVFVMHFVTGSGGEPTVLQGRREGDRLIFEGAGPMGKLRQTLHYGDGRMEVTSAVPDPEADAWTTIFHGQYRLASGGS
jgi:hypothetical protein